MGIFKNIRFLKKLYTVIKYINTIKKTIKVFLKTFFDNCLKSNISVIFER